MDAGLFTVEDLLTDGIFGSEVIANYGLQETIDLSAKPVAPLAQIIERNFIPEGTGLIEHLQMVNDFVASRQSIGHELDEVVLVLAPAECFNNVA